MQSNTIHYTTGVMLIITALSAILGKLLDRIVLVRYGDLLCSSDLQFGFKRGRSTSMCTLVLKETIEYYVHNSSTVY